MSIRNDEGISKLLDLADDKFNENLDSQLKYWKQQLADAVALVFEEQQLTYRELNRRANQLAHYLKTLGVGPEVLVGICVERSLEMVVGMLGIIKAGGAYVPLEPRLPQERHFLSQKLPDYMIPSAFAILDTLPLTPNGKVDRRAIASVAWQPSPDTNSLTVGDRFVAPTTPTQEVLAAIWSKVLGLDKVGIHDNFFDLGGHSLLATQVISSCYQTFGVKLSLRQLFATPTVAGLAVAITNAQMSGSGLSDYQIIPQRVNQESAPLSFAQQRLWFLEQLEPNRSDYHICQAVRLSGALNVTALQLALDAIVAHHEVLRTNFIYEDGNPIQVISAPRPVELASVDLQEYPPTQQQTEVQTRLQHSRQRPFNLSEDLMLRGSLLQMGPQEHILLLVMHHIASDGWSRGIILQQLNSLYKAFCHGQPNPLPKMPIQYADFAVWQRQWLQGVGADPCSPQKTQLDYWKQQLAGANPVLELPTDYPRPPVQTYSGASQSIVLNQSLTTALKVLSRQEQVTLNFFSHAKTQRRKDEVFSAAASGDLNCRRQEEHKEKKSYHYISIVGFKGV